MKIKHCVLQYLKDTLNIKTLIENSHLYVETYVRQNAPVVAFIAVLSKPFLTSGHRFFPHKVEGHTKKL